MILRLIDICLPDYFPGSDVPYLQVAAYSDMTYADLCEALESEARDVLGEDAMLEFMDTLESYFSPSDDIVLHFSYAPNSDDDTDTVYCYVAIISQP